MVELLGEKHASETELIAACGTDLPTFLPQMLIAYTKQLLFYPSRLLTESLLVAILVEYSAKPLLQRN